MAGSAIHRITLFKIPGEEDRQKVLDMYKQMRSRAVKDGKQYIQSITAGATKEDQRSQGYTVAATTVFESYDDMVYYDNECAAHAELKVVAKPMVQGVLMAYFENEMSS